MNLGCNTPRVTACEPADLVDHDRYPVDRLDSPDGRALVDHCAAQLRETGACELPGFLTTAGLDAALADACALEPLAYRSGGLGTAYLASPPDDLPDEHPRRWRGPHAVGVVAYDQFPAESPIRQLYEWGPLREFLAAVLGHDVLHPYADPFGALNLAVMADGDELQWHFDMTDFVVSLALRDAEAGGDFETVPRIRSHDAENYEHVAEVLAGDNRDVVTIEMSPGTLLLFEGRHSLHRVSPISGPTTRLVALLAYDTKPGTCGSATLARHRYGRVTPLHR